MEEEATTLVDIDTSELYPALMAGNIRYLKANKSKIGNFLTPAKKTVLHIHITSQSKRKREGKREKTETVHYMLKEWPSLLRKADRYGFTPLHVAAWRGLDEIVRTLLCYAATEENGHMVLDMLHETNAYKETALHQAVRWKHDEVAKVLIGVDDPTFSYSANEDGETPLYMAAERGMWHVVELILKKYTSPAYEGPNGRTALHAAAIYSRSTRAVDMHVSVVKAIIKKQGLEFLTTKADNDGRTPLHYHPALLLRSGDRSAIRMADKDGNTAHHIAASEGNLLGVKELLKYSPEYFELVNKEGRNVLHLAATSNNEEMVDLILGNVHLNHLQENKDNHGIMPMDLIATSKISLKETAVRKLKIWFLILCYVAALTAFASRSLAVLGYDAGFVGTVAWIVAGLSLLVVIVSNDALLD